jgi:microcystin-dependent protein
VANPYVGEIRNFGFTFAPSGWALCNGQLLPISQNTALFSLIGTFYGGNGTSNFALPNLQSRVAIHMGQGAGLSPYQIGQASGVENQTLLTSQLPTHSHQATATDGNAAGTRPGGSVPGRVQTAIYAPAPDGTILNAGTVGTAGGSQPFSVLEPYLSTNFCIALFGIFPARN